MQRSLVIVAIAFAYACGNDVDRRASRAAPRAAVERSYVGAQRCGECHDAALAFWNNTRHARAFFTLEKAGKQSDRACVACHVTGFEKPGGHRSARAAGLEAVQCEICHGPGSRHAATESLAAIDRAPERALCRSCHQPPQVPEGWDIEVAWPKILGPGHGAPL